MGNIANAYRSRARRVHAVTQAQLGREAAMIRAGVVEAVQEQLYQRTTLKVSGRLLRSIRLQFLGNSFRVGFDQSAAPYVRRRLEMTGTSKTGGHLLDMDVSGHLRANVYSKIRVMRAATLRQIIGPGVTSGP